MTDSQAALDFLRNSHTLLLQAWILAPREPLRQLAYERLVAVRNEERAMEERLHQRSWVRHHRSMP